ncbi:MAG: metallophosphoesterase [Lachnospiraceae bacterium]|nr:metallophosphoesterase [Lachnospiraceae bacterium]
MKKGLKVLLIVLGVFAFLYLAGCIANIICNANLRKYIKSFEPVSYSSDRVVPVKEDDHYSITVGGDLKIMQLTDIHIGGGFWTYKNDKKTIYEVITMLQKEAPDIVVLTGDNTYCLPGIGYNGGFTANNIMVAKTLITIFDHEGVYFTTVFGNHDTEALDYAGRARVGALYESDFSKYCFFESEYTDPDAKTVPSVTNQIIKLKDKEGNVIKLLLLIDSNAYQTTGLISSIKGQYDVIHDAQVDWAKEETNKLSKEAGLPEGEYLKALCFMHIPVGEYQAAREEVESNNLVNTQVIGGDWDEKVCYGGLHDDSKTPVDQDKFFEVMCEETNCVEAIFCGHDHVNDAVLEYKGVMLSYGYSLDNEAYGDKIMYSGLQRGATVITVNEDGSFTQQHKNAYLDYNVETNRFVDVYLDRKLYPEN